MMDLPIHYGDRGMPSTRKTLPRLGNITMRGSVERIYTTTYYIPSSPTEVRAYTPILPKGYYLKEP
jgi:hypothetical protein